MSGYVQTNQSIQLLNANTRINAADTGKLLLIPQITGVAKTYTLPVAAAGLHYRFMVNSVGVFAFSAIIQPGDTAGAPVNALVSGLVINSPTAVTLACIRKAGDNVATFTTAVVLGDFIDCYCDGTNWHVQGISGANNGLS